jgi:hypothetical protein
MTCTVTINTHYFATEAEAYSCWEKTLGMLGAHLAERRGLKLDRIY